MSNQQLRNPVWIGFDGEPVAGRTPTRVFVYGPKMTSQQQGELVRHYNKFCQDNSLALGQYQLRERYMPDGTRFRMVSVNGADTVYVWTSGGEKHLYFFYPFPTVIDPFTSSDFLPNYRFKRQMDGDPVKQRAYLPKETTRIKKTDGVLLLLMGDSEGVPTKPSPVAVLHKDTRTGIAELLTDVVHAGEPQGNRHCAFLPALQDTESGTVYLGSYYHGSVVEDEGVVTIESGVASVSFPSAFKVETPNTHLVQFEWLPAPTAPVTDIVGPISLLNYAVLYGKERNYDALTQLRIGEYNHPYVVKPEEPIESPETPKPSDHYFTVNVAPYQATEDVPEGGVVSVYVTVTVDRGTAGKNREFSVLVNNQTFLFPTNRAGRYATTTVFSPNGSKFCVVVHHAGSLSEADYNEAIQNNDPRPYSNPMFAIEGVLVGGDNTEFPSCTLSVVSGIPEYMADDFEGSFQTFGYTTAELGSPIIGRRRVVLASGSLTGESLGGTTIRYTVERHYEEFFDYLQPVVFTTTTPIMITYGRSNDLQIINGVLTQTRTLSTLSTTDNRPLDLTWSYTTTDGLLVSADPPSQTTLEYDYRTIMSYEGTLEIYANEDLLFTKNFGVRNYDYIWSGTDVFTERETDADFVNTFFEWVTFVPDARSESGAGYETLSNNVSLASTHKNAPGGAELDWVVITPVSGSSRVADPKIDNKQWGAWHPINDEVIFEEFKSWC